MGSCPNRFLQSSQNFHGLVQRLVQKEKQVLQLQTQLDRLKSQNPNENRENDDKGKREREKTKLNNLQDELVKIKAKVRYSEPPQLVFSSLILL